jgi:hypothetical protein
VNKNHSLRKFITVHSFNLTLGVITFIGIVLRLRQYLSGRSFWLDEVMLAINIVNRSFKGLLDQPMEYEQGVPIGFLFGEKLFYKLFGSSEYALRLFPFLIGCFILILIIPLAKKYLNKAGALTVITFFAISYSLVYYSSELKQYIGDVAATLTLLWLFSYFIERETDWKDFTVAGVISTFLMWFSHPAVFIVAGIYSTLALHYWIRKDWKNFGRLIIVIVALGINFVVIYLIHLRHLTSSKILVDFWQDGFMPLPPWNNFWWFGNTWKGILENPLEITIAPLLAFFIFALGLYFMFRRQWQFGVVLTFPLFFAMVASALQKYSLIGRMTLFIVPIFLIIFGAGIDSIKLFIKKKWIVNGVQIILAVYLIFSPLQISIENFLHPTYNEHIRPTLTYLKDHIKPKDLVYVDYYAEPAVRFYAPKFGFDTSQFIMGQNHQEEPVGYHEEINRLIGHKRVWVIFSHVYENNHFSEKEYILNYIGQIGKKDREYRVAGTSVDLYLYDLSAGP